MMNNVCSIINNINLSKTSKNKHMKNYIYIKLCILAIGIFSFASCSDDEPTKIALFLPKADFAYDASSMAIAFTDKSENAVSYLWDFGDGETSTEQNPVHEFQENLEYTVLLTVANKDGATHQKTLKLDLLDGPAPDPNVNLGIKIDGNFADWDNVPADRVFTATLEEHITDRTSMRLIKFCGDANYLYFYAVVEKDRFGVLSFYIDKDNNTETGYLGTSWSKTMGADYLMEAPQEDGVFVGGAYAYNDAAGKGTGWEWNEFIAAGPKALTLSNIVERGDGLSEVEGYLSRAEYPDLGFTIKIGTSVSNSSWSTTGRIPGATIDGSTPQAFKVRIPQ